jgi:hypothetical protein
VVLNNENIYCGEKILPIYLHSWEDFRYAGMSRTLLQSSCLRDKEMQAQKGQVICPRSPNNLMLNWGLESGPCSALPGCRLSSI